jgi:hypothetical protein
LGGAEGKADDGVGPKVDDADVIVRTGLAESFLEPGIGGVGTVDVDARRPIDEKDHRKQGTRTMEHGLRQSEHHRGNEEKTDNDRRGADRTRKVGATVTPDEVEGREQQKKNQRSWIVERHTHPALP